MSTARRFLAALSMVTIAGSLSACAGATGHGVTIPPGADKLVQCPPAPIDATDLSSQGDPGCDLVGSLVRLPDGTSLEVREVGAVAWHQSSDTNLNEYTIVNWGVPGVGISIVKEGRLVDLWASSADAEELQREQLRVEGIEPS
ncbi:hypothetical protein ACSS7Z_04355 [Microbacterium sp. A82]|uniref:hypothetical protein n=1 Tax=unclassified Microbacterium TaxID=2609290 RepID=UPI003F34945F